MPSAVILSVIIACVVAVGAFALGVVVIRYGPKDKPDGGRKTQVRAMPTSGGIAVFCSVFVGTLCLVAIHPDLLTFPGAVLFGGAVYMFLMGLWDDIVELPAIPKLLAQLVIAAVVAWFGVRVGHFDLGRHIWETGLVVGVLGSMAWLVVVTNAVNFMDGADGLAMGSCAVIAAGLAFLAGLTGAYDIMSLSLILFGGLAGHLFWNGRGKLFTGDSGALFVGFYLAGLVLLWISRLQLSVWIAPLFFIAFLTDVLLTLIWRYQHGRNLLKAHNEHIYQIMLRSGLTQMLTASVFAWATMHGILIGGISLMFPQGAAMLGFALLSGIFYIINRKIRASALNEGLLSD